MGSCFRQPACEKAASWPESTNVPPRASHFPQRRECGSLFYKWTLLSKAAMSG